MSAQADHVSRPRVLFVDDEPRVLNSMRIMFRREYDTFFADNGSSALGILKAHEIDVIVCDHRMPEMTGVEVLAQAKAISPRSVRILLTGYADLNAVEGSINEGEVFRFLTKPCPPEQLKETIKLASELAAATDTDVHGRTNPAIEITLEGERSFVGRDDAGIPATADPGSTVTLDARVADTPADRRPTELGVDPGMGVLVFTTDAATYEAVVDATRGRIPVYRASNIAQVVRTLTERKPGVLLTDISEDRVTIQNMTAKLKAHLPELVTVAVSEHRDVLDMVWLINHGQIFRFLRKPLSAGRIALSLRAALEHHRKLVTNPALVKRHTVVQTEDDGDTPGWMSRLYALRRLWSKR
jgi:DNA-binding NtrC family response regulator